MQTQFCEFFKLVYDFSAILILLYVKTRYEFTGINGKMVACLELNMSAFPMVMHAQLVDFFVIKPRCLL